MQEYRSRYTDHYNQEEATGIYYDEGVGNKFESVIYNLETKLLVSIFKEFCNSNAGTRYLDFACGTGRILLVFKEAIKSLIGVDTSPFQLKRAKAKLPEATLILGNIVTNPELLNDKKFDFITCFRLFLNLEKNNRVCVLKQVTKLLDDDGYLVVDNHMNRYSIMGIIALFMHKVLRYPYKSQIPVGQKGIIGTMSEMEFRTSLSESGLKVIRTYRFFLFPGYKSFTVLPERWLIRLEEMLSRILFINLLSKNQIFVCQKQKGLS